MHTLPNLIRWRRITIDVSVEATRKLPYPLYTALMDSEIDYTNMFIEGVWQFCLINLKLCHSLIIFQYKCLCKLIDTIHVTVYTK